MRMNYMLSISIIKNKYFWTIVKSKQVMYQTKALSILVDCENVYLNDVATITYDMIWKQVNDQKLKKCT